MNEHNNNTHEIQLEKKPVYSKNMEQLEDKDKALVFVLWQLHNSKLTTGSKIFFEPLKEKYGISKATFQNICYFLSGANLAVERIVISNKVPTHIIERYGLLNE